MARQDHRMPGTSSGRRFTDLVAAEVTRLTLFFEDEMEPPYVGCYDRLHRPANLALFDHSRSRTLKTTSNRSESGFSDRSDAQSGGSDAQSDGSDVQSA